MSPIALPALAKDAARLDVAEFAERHGKAFFVVLDAPHASPGVAMRTRSATDSDRASGVVGANVVVSVFPVRRRPENAHPFVGVGRLDGNDIPIGDETVSKFHAYVKERDGGYLLQDASSRNGTTVDGKPVAARGVGPPTPLAIGQSVKFGSVSTTFLDAAAVMELARRLGTAKAP